jgi:hypothetical protein
MTSKYALTGAAIACVITWYVLKFDGLVPTMAAVAVGSLVGQAVGSLAGKK